MSVEESQVSIERKNILMQMTWGIQRLSYLRDVVRVCVFTGLNIILKKNL